VKTSVPVLIRKEMLMIRLSNIRIRIENINAENENEVLKNIILEKLRIKEKDLFSFRISKKSTDARKKAEIYLVYTLDAEVSNEERVLSKNQSNDIFPAPSLIRPRIRFGNEKLHFRPVVVGMGPTGIFAALNLAINGYRPIVLERGEDVDSRTEKNNAFWNGGKLDTESNVQFGEGGAGTFSDGKLTTLINDPRCSLVLEEFVNAGAPQEILYKSKPHIGTDLLRSVVKNLRKTIIAYGGDVRFRSRVTDFIIRDGKITGIEINGEEILDCNVVILAIGHSARDTFEVLSNKGVEMCRKPFSIGVRIEHPQEVINRAQYGKYAGNAMLGAADYKLAYHADNGRSAYTFCMCPGGYVVAAASEERQVVTNGMSEFKRDGANANSALLVSVGPEDFPGQHPLAGVEFQRKWEQLAFQLGGSDYRAPVQLIEDFLNDRTSTGFGSVRPTYKPGVSFAPIKDCLPKYVIETMKKAIVYFDTKIKGFAMPDGILTGVETRSSSPVRILRDTDCISNIKGLYPAGEGAGYAGGIMSSAVDGLKASEKVMEKYSPLK